jgi:O-antigen/teichoic acid export membrane protein
LLFATGTTLIDMLYDDRYRLAGPLVEILALSLFATRYEVANQCYLALGKSALITPVTVARMVPLFALTPVAFHFGGLIAAAWAIALAPLASVPLHLYLLKRNGLLDLRKEIVTLPLALLGYLAGRAFTGLLG